MSSPDYHEIATEWTREPFDEVTRSEVRQLIDSDSSDLEESFYKELAFGTGGMRGIMGVGTNRINRYTLGRNAKGLALYLKSQFPDEQTRVAIAYDCRRNSRELAYTVAGVLSAEGVMVYIYPELRPTPVLSFTLTRKDCHAGIVLTASHNPPEYNGFKVYWQDGGQLVPPHDKSLMKQISELRFQDISFEQNEDLIQELDSSDDEAFAIASVENGRLAGEKIDRSDLKIVFTSLHGTSITMVPEVLKKAGYTDVNVVAEQAEPDGEFPTVDSPNPEEPEALALAMQLADKLQADIVIGTDPDSDRLGIAVRNPEGIMTILNGNQTMVLMTDYILSQTDLKTKQNPFIASTIVSTPMMQRLADHYGLELKLGLTGFKWIAKMIKDHPDQDFIGGGEESFGYMVGDFVRDKDAVTATLLACEIAAFAKQQGSSIYEYLTDLYIKHGLYREQLVSLVKKGISGEQEIKQMLEDLRSSPPSELGGISVIRFQDYLEESDKNLISGEVTKLDLPSSNVLTFYLKDGTQIAARPSGTEPKIKFYVSVNDELQSSDHLIDKEDELNHRITAVLKDLGVN